MTTQSMPISRDRKDYILSVLALIIIGGLATAAVYLSKPDAIIMRQPRMTIAAGIAVTVAVTAFIFIGRSAQPFYTRILSWSLVCLSVIFLFAMGFFTDQGSDGGWFRFALLCLVIIGSTTVLTELMVGYRKFVAKKSFKNHIAHVILFSLVCGAIAFGTTYFYYEKAVSGGAVISYNSPAPINTNVPNQNLEDLTSSSLPGLTTPQSSVDTTVTSSPATEANK